MSRCWCCSLFAGAWLLACSGHEAEPAGVVRTALRDGLPDDIHSFVVGIYTLEQGQPALCTGTLVGPNLVLTSRHCVAPRLDEGSSVDCASSRFGATFDPSWIQVTTAEHMYPELLALPESVSRIWVRDSRRQVCGNDIALLAIGAAGGAAGLAGASAGMAGASPGAGGDSAGSAGNSAGSAGNSAGGAGAFFGVEAAAGRAGFDGDRGASAGSGPLVGEVEPALVRLDEPARQAERYAAVGYGSTGETFGDRMAIEQLEVGCVGASCSKRIVDGEFFGGGALCRGDSGSPALDEQGRVFGVASRGDSQCTESVYSDLAAHKDWLVASVREASAYLGQAPPRWARDGSSGAAGAGQAGASSAGISGAEPAGQASSPTDTDGAAAEQQPARVRLGGGCVYADGRGRGEPARVAAGLVLALLLGLALLPKCRRE